MTQARLRRDPPAPAARRSAAAVLQHLPGQRTKVAGYDDTLTPEQVAAMMPTAPTWRARARASTSGTRSSGSRQPVRFNLSEGSDSDRNTTILSVGALGSGKTTLDQKLKYEGFLQGARIIDCDPKGDHRFHLLEEVAPHTECVTLKPDPALRGVLDPLRVAPEHLRQDAAVSFLRDLLPGRAEPAWETAVVGAVDRVLRRSSEPTCLEVVRALEQGDETDAQVGKTLEVYARSGLTQLGFADPAVKLPPVGQSQVTYLPIRDLPGPRAGDARAEYSQAERVGEQIVRLIAMFAMHLMGAERGRLKLFSFDEGWRLLGRPGRAAAAGLAAAHGPLGAGGADHLNAARDGCAGRRARVAGEPARGDVRVRDALRGGGGARAGSCLGWTRKTAGCARACSSSRRGAVCSATTQAGWRRSRSTWCCRRCCVPFRRLPGLPDGAVQAPRSGGSSCARVAGRARRGFLRPAPQAPHMSLFGTGPAETRHSTAERRRTRRRERSTGKKRSRGEDPTGESPGAGAEQTAAGTGSGATGLEPRRGSLGLGVLERRRPAGGQRVGQSPVPQGRECRTVAGRASATVESRASRRRRRRRATTGSTCTSTPA